MVNATVDSVSIGNIAEKTAFFGGLIIAFFFYLFCKYFLYRSVDLKISWSYFYVGLLMLWAYITYGTDIFILYSERVDWYITTYHNPYAYIAWVITLFVPFIIGLMQLRKKLKNSDCILRQKIKTIWTLLIVSIIGSFTFDVLFTGLHQYQFNNIGPFFSLLFDLSIVMLIYSRDTSK